MKNETIICDIDGTIADDYHRAKISCFDDNLEFTVDEDGFIEYENINFKKYFDPILMKKDKPNLELREKLWDHSNKGRDIIYLTARPENIRKETQDWLDVNHFPGGWVIMFNNENIPSREFKIKSIDKIKKMNINPIFAYGDRKGDIDAYEYHNIPYERIILESRKNV